MRDLDYDVYPNLTEARSDAERNYLFNENALLLAHYARRSIPKHILRGGLAGGLVGLLASDEASIAITAGVIGVGCAGVDFLQHGLRNLYRYLKKQNSNYEIANED